jgi:tRNA nucleotidyltransferase (CCA-adding enzyme)
MTVLTDKRPVQITTFRADGTYSDNRHPDQVQFSRDIADDLARRDFTINAMAYSQESGLIDPFGGWSDLQSRTLRAVGQAEQRLAEDALRIMRALRFAATLGFTIDDELREALHQQKGLLAQISPERIQVELMKMLEADGQQLQTVLLEFGDVLAVPIPEIAPMIGMDQLSPWHAYDVWEHSVRALAASDASDRYVRLALLLHDIGKPATFTIDANGRGHFYAHAPVGGDLAAMRLEALRFDRQTIETTSELVRAHFAPITAETILKWLRRYGEPQLRRLIKVKQADMQAHIDTAVGQGMAQLQKALDALDQAIVEEACFSLKQLSIGGDDLIGIGYASGPELGATLEALLDAVIEGKLPNERDALLDAVIEGRLPNERDALLKATQRGMP